MKILTILLVIYSQSTLGQTTFELTGQLTDCTDSLPLALGHMFLKLGDSVIESAPINDNGLFKFKKLSPGTFQLESYYFFFPKTRREVHIPNDSVINICVFEGNSDSLLANYKARRTYTIYYYGLPNYSDEDLDQVGKQYGVKWQNLGCQFSHNFDKYNKVIHKILRYKNGKDWQDNFWKEVKKKYGQGN